VETKGELLLPNISHTLVNNDKEAVNKLSLIIDISVNYGLLIVTSLDIHCILLVKPARNV